MKDHVTVKAPHYANTLQATWGGPPMRWMLTLLLKFTDLPLKMGPDLLQAGPRLANSRRSAARGTMCGRAQPSG